jgi:5-methylcytosine-specific restriction endonuclease McrA
MNKVVRQEVKLRARHLCEYCHCPEYFSPDPFELDHIFPLSAGGDSQLDNLALACSGCNGHKSDSFVAIDPGTGQLSHLYNPRKDNWEEHFRWDAEFLLIVGISPTGRATIDKIKVNRENVVNLRRVLAKAGEHPSR